MTYFKLIYRKTIADIKQSVIYMIPNFILLLLIISVYGLDMFIQVKNYYRYNLSSNGSFTISFIDLFLFIFGGDEPYYGSLGQSFVFPVRWILIYLFIFFSILNYVNKDFCELGLHKVTRTGRTNWIISTGITHVVQAACFYILSITYIIILTFFIGGKISISPNQQLFSELLGISINADIDIIDFIVIQLIDIMIIALLCFIQTIICIYSNSVIAFMVTSSMLIFCSYFCNDLLLCNYLMMFRAPFISLGTPLSLKYGVIVYFLFLFVCIIVAILYIKKKEFLSSKKVTFDLQ